jgi:gliding motility-associated lipoprotein GldH
LKKSFLLFFYSILICIFSCTRIDLYEKLTPVPAHEWRGNFKPQFSFTITDTTASYQPFLILRHNDKYSYNNIWLNIYIKNPDNTIQKFQIEKVLATNAGWLGTGMDDIYEHRLPLTPEAIQFKKSGHYIFTLEHIMREDPLENIMDVGLRLEKKP